MENTTMKKTYINPKLEVVKIAVHQMLAASPDGFDNSIDTTGGDGNDALTRDIDEDWSF